MKLVLNMIMGTMMASLAEGVTLAQACDLPAKDVIEALGLGALAAPMFAIKVRFGACLWTSFVHQAFKQ